MILLHSKCSFKLHEGALQVGQKPDLRHFSDSKLDNQLKLPRTKVLDLHLLPFHIGVSCCSKCCPVLFITHELFIWAQKLKLCYRELFLLSLQLFLFFFFFSIMQLNARIMDFFSFTLGFEDSSWAHMQVAFYTIY